jgi:Ser/Thr protein kinase RdoA (MazF antagonist)
VNIPFEKLSYLGQLRRMRLMAQAASDAYGLADARIKFLRQAGNTLYQIYAASPVPTARTDLYAQGKYMLRIHQPGYQTTEAIALELAWLAAMCRDANLPVPEPVSTLDGSLLVQVSMPGIPGERNCSLLHWVKGRQIPIEEAQPRHYRAQGQLMARMHQHAAQWQPPAGLAKRKFDWDGLFREDSGTGIPASEAWSLLPQKYLKPFERVTSEVKQVMDEWGKGPQVYGLIHGDLGLDANLLFWGGEARAIDFDDSGFGYYMYDLSLALEHCQDDPGLPQFRAALLDGYTRLRLLPESQLKYLDLFLAAYYVYLSLWAAAATQAYPHHRQVLSRRMERAFRLVERYVSKRAASAGRSSKG